MARWHSVVAALLLGCAASAQSANSNQARATGLALLTKAAILAQRLPLNARLDFLGEVAVTQFMAGDNAGYAVTQRAAIAAYQAQIAEMEAGPHWSSPPNPQAFSGAFSAAEPALSQAYELSLVKDRAGVHTWIAIAQGWFPKMKDDSERLSMETAMVGMQIGVSDEEDAEQTIVAARADSPGPGDRVLIAASEAEAAKGDFNAARQIIQPLGVREGWTALVALGGAETKAGDIEEGKADFAAVEKALADVPDGVDASIALAEGRAGMLGDALTLMMRAVLSNASGLETLGGVAARQGNLDIARRCFAAAREAYRANTRDDARFVEGELEMLASHQAASGDIAGAFNTVSLLSDAAFHSSALVGISMAQANAGNLAGARQTLAQADASPSAAVGAQQAIAFAEARQGNFGDALALAKQGLYTAEPGFRAYCTPQRAAACIAAAGNLANPGARAGALLGIAERLLGVRRPFGVFLWFTA